MIRINAPFQMASKDSQTIINETIAEGGLCYIAHPNLPGPWPVDILMSVKGYNGLEIYNEVAISFNKTSTSYSVSSDTTSTSCKIVKSSYEYAEDKWDYLLTNDKKVFGITVDDAHWQEGIDKAWVMVYADNLTTKEIVDNLKNGNFYSSTGCTLDISVNKNDIIVSTDSESTIEFIISNGEVIKTAKKTKIAAYPAKGNEKYVRVRIKRDSDGRQAWSNPVFISANTIK